MLFRCVALFLVISSSLAHADWRKHVSVDDFQMAPPPAVGSTEDLADLEELRSWQARRTSDQCDLAQQQKDATFKDLFYTSPVLNPGQYRRVEGLLTEVVDFGRKVSKRFKKEFNRQRPFERFADLEPCVERPSLGRSYPSSHAMVGMLSACVLARVFPRMADALNTYGHEVGDLRVVVGVHHPSDVAAGKRLGAEICMRLFKEKDFVEEVKGL